MIFIGNYFIKIILNIFLLILNCFLRYYIIYYRYLTLAVHSAPDVVTVDHMETGGEVQTIPVRSVNVEMKISTATNNHVL